MKNCFDNKTRGLNEYNKFPRENQKQISRYIKLYYTVLHKTVDFDDMTLIIWNLASYIESERSGDDGRETTTNTTTMTRTRTTQKFCRRGRQSDTMDFEECNFRRHTTMAMPTYLPRRIISSSARAVLIFRASWESSRLGKTLEPLVLVAIEGPRVFLNFRKFCSAAKSHF